MGNGISASDINHMIDEKDEHKQKTMSEKIFQAMDKDKSGALDKKELMALVKVWWEAVPWLARKLASAGSGETALLEKWEEAFFEVMDENKDGKISFEEWHKAVVSGIVKAQKDGWTDSAF